MRLSATAGVRLSLVLLALTVLLGACGGSSQGRAAVSASPVTGRRTLARLQLQGYLQGVEAVFLRLAKARPPRATFDPANKATWSRFAGTVAWGIGRERSITAALSSIVPPAPLAGPHADLVRAHQLDCQALRILLGYLRRRTAYSRWRRAYQARLDTIVHDLQVWDRAQAASIGPLRTAAVPAA
jgi:hypothetical protein